MIKSALKSNSFRFRELKKQTKKIKVIEYKSFSKNLNIIKFNFFKNQKMNYIFNNNSGNEFILLVTSGAITFNLKKKIHLKAYDAINFFSKSLNLEINALKKGSAFLISAKPYKNFNNYRLKYFNFIKNIKARDLWGGQCVSRPYEAKFITLVLFDLKKGFKFEDKGHFNEQITWIINGKMNFNINNKTFYLYKNCGVDIRPNQPHGGTSMGAVGFDVFFPKRNELGYKNKFIY
jgi:mannose-6-phosphate isomerase-like protein (cupin superfamily)